MMYFKRSDWHPSRIYVKDIKDVDNLIRFTSKNDYTLVAREQRNIQRINEITTTLHDLFLFLEILIIVIIAFYLIYFGLKSIKQNHYQIGVIKALGGRNRDVEKIFVLKTFIIGIIISILSALVSTTFISLANGILLASIEQLLGMKLSHINIITINPMVLLFDATLLVIISFISSLIPTILLKKIKPVEIIKAKE